MKLFTIKDIIKYNNPCKSCGRKTEFYFKILPTNNDFSIGSPLKPIVTDGTLSFILSTKYKSTLAMIVNPVTNKFTLQSNAREAVKSFEEFQSTNYLLAESNCKNCGTMITSDFFDFDGNVIKPIKLFTETVHLTGQSHKFTLSTSFSTNKTFVVADIISKATPITPFSTETPAMPLFKFKDKEALLKRLKLILTFS